MDDEKSKKLQVSLSFTREECARLISFVKENELYKDSHRMQSSRKKKWDHISQSLGRDGEQNQITLYQ